MKIENGSLLLFRLFGVNVWLNWTWLLGLALFLQRDRQGDDRSILFFIGIYLCLFLIVLTHEFGHSLACKSVGGTSERIVLTPFGGIAYVNAPPRPGATLWSIAAGPLVNVVLLPVTFGLAFLSASINASPTAQSFVSWIAYINLGLLVFNMLPIYPLDGGQILRS
ncbi:MAG TPA: M50 family metallopeptidase, partial [Phycisphaerae bacterium]